MAATAYVWVWLPGASVPVVAGRLDADGTHEVDKFGFWQRQFLNPYVTYDY